MTTTPDPGPLRDESSGTWWIFLTSVAVMATALRLAFPAGIAVEHFDEGVYASNLWCPDTLVPGAYSYPDRHLYAPPLLPSAIESSQLLLGSSDLPAIVPSLLAGTVLILVLGGLVRHWFGEPTARAVVMLAACSDVHILYSRTALTDVSWITWLVIAVGLSHRGLVAGRPLILIAAGIATGLGWWIKYTGWLPLAITAAGIGITIVLIPSTRGRCRAWLLRLCLIISVTAATIAPLFWSLGQTGGYGPVARNHARFLVGIPGWVGAAVEQARNLMQIESVLTVAGLVLATWLATGLARPTGRFTWNAIGPRVLLPLALAGLAAAVSFTLLVIPMAIFALADGFRQARHRTAQSTPCDNRHLAWGMLAAWWIAMTLSTPLYYPYPRLALPWLIAGWILVGRQIVTWTTAAGDPRPTRPRWQLLTAAGLGLVLLIVAIPGRLLPRGIPAWQPRTAIADLSDQLIGRVLAANPDGLTVIRVWGEPALFYQLNTRAPDRLLLQPAGGLSVIAPGQPAPEAAVFLVVGPHVIADDETRQQDWSAFTLIDSFKIRPGLQVRLNQPSDRREQAMTFRLYRWRPIPDFPVPSDD